MLDFHSLVLSASEYQYIIKVPHVIHIQSLSLALSFMKQGMALLIIIIPILWQSICQIKERLNEWRLNSVSWGNTTLGNHLSSNHITEQILACVSFVFSFGNVRRGGPIFSFHGLNIFVLLLQHFLLNTFGSSAAMAGIVLLLRG